MQRDHGEVHRPQQQDAATAVVERVQHTDAYWKQHEMPLNHGGITKYIQCSRIVQFNSTVVLKIFSGTLAEYLILKVWKEIRSFFDKSDVATCCIELYGQVGGKILTSLKWKWRTKITILFPKSKASSTHAAPYFESDSYERRLSAASKSPIWRAQLLLTSKWRKCKYSSSHAAWGSGGCSVHSLSVPKRVSIS